MTSFGSILTAGYRADGMRASKQNSSGRTYYFYDGDTLIIETDATGAKTAVNTNGPSRLLARTDATRTLLFAFDALGQLSQQVIAGAGTVAATYLFDAWGTRSVSSTDTPATNDPYSGYGNSSGYISDWETGLQLLGHRYYDPTTGRFLNRDPVGMAGGVNIYSYCGNGTLYKNDSSGYGPIPSWVQACFGGALGNALGSIWDVIRGRPGDQAAKSGACSVIFGCIISALIWWLINAATSGGDTASEGAVSGCLAGAASSFVATLCASQFCHERINWLCTILGMVAACLGGILGGWGSFAKDKILQGIGWAFTIGGVGLRIAMLAVLQNRMVCQKLNST